MRSSAAGSGSRSTARRTSPSAASAPGATASGWSGLPWATLLRGVTSRRRWIGRSLDGLPPLELTWVCCGVDYPKLVEGAADYLLYSGTQALGPRPRLPAPRGGRRLPGNVRGRALPASGRLRKGWWPRPTRQRTTGAGALGRPGLTVVGPTLGRGGREQLRPARHPDRMTQRRRCVGEGPGLAPRGRQGLGRGAGSARMERSATARDAPPQPRGASPAPTAVPREQAQTQTNPPTAARASAGRPTPSSRSRSRRTPPGGAPHGRGPRRGGRPRRRGR